ncbi:hypothetical protein LZ31DRAFT_289297 [Colletotrichum somersetense]|nr:hypothetical protein LZ31DRAFT_289297 [Colletotrichum somersetense]
MARDILQRHSLTNSLTQSSCNTNTLLPLSENPFLATDTAYDTAAYTDTVRCQSSSHPLLPTLPVTPSTDNASANIRILDAYAYSVLACSATNASTV